MTATIDPRLMSNPAPCEREFWEMLRYRSEASPLGAASLVGLPVIDTQPDEDEKIRRQYYWAALVNDVMWAVTSTVAALREALSLGFTVAEDFQKRSREWNALVTHWAAEYADRVLYPQNLEDFIKDASFVLQHHARTGAAVSSSSNEGEISTILARCEDSLYRGEELVKNGMRTARWVQDQLERDQVRSRIGVSFRVADLQNQLSDLAVRIAADKPSARRARLFK